MHTPKIFISATSGDLRSIRQVVKEALLTINCHPVEQSNFEPNARTVEAMLRDKIGDCQALIHICGMRYGAEPDIDTLSPGSPRRSYTQWEYHIGRQLQEERGDAHFRVYTFICPEEFPYEKEPDIEPQEKRDLQKAHRSRLFDDPHLWEKPKDATHLQHRVLALQEQVLALKQQQAEVKTELIKNRHLGLKAFAVLLLLLGGIYAGMHLLKQSVETLPTRVEESIRKGYTVDASRIRIQLEAASKLKLDADIALANDIAKHPKWDDRQKLREEAEAAHQQRLSRVTEYAENFAELAAAQDASPVLIEMGRIIETEGVDAAIAYFETQRGDVFKRAKSRLASANEAIRRELQPSLKVAGLLATRGNSAAARASYEEILALEPDWPEAIDAFAWFLFEASFQSLTHGSQHDALADAESMHALATRRLSVAPEDPRTLRLFSAASNQLADALMLRRQPGDAEKAFAHYQRSLEISEKLLSTNPDSAESAHNVFISLIRLGDFLISRGQPGDAEKALAYFQRNLEMTEKILAANPDSDQAARDVSVSLGKLSTFLASRRQPSDAEMTLAHYQRSLKIDKKLLSANPDSDQAARDVSVRLNNLGAFLVSRGQPGDAQNALGYFQQCLEINEKLLSTNPDSALAARDVSASLNNLGDFFASRGQPGDAEQAISHFQRSIEIREKLLSANPDSAQALRDLSVSMNKLADILANSKQPEVAKKALGYYQQGLQIADKLLTANPDSAQAASDVSFSLERIGHFLARRDQPGDAKKALGYFQRCLEIREKLLSANPDSAEAARAVSVSMNKLGDYYASRDEPEEAKKALSYYQGCLKIAEKLLSANPDSAAAARDVAFSHYRLSAYCNGWGDAAGKKKHRRACYDILAPRIADGMNFDPPIMKLFQELKQEFGGK